MQRNIHIYQIHYCDLKHQYKWIQQWTCPNGAVPWHLSPFLSITVESSVIHCDHTMSLNYKHTCAQVYACARTHMHTLQFKEFQKYVQMFINLTRSEIEAARYVEYIMWSYFRVKHMKKEDFTWNDKCIYLYMYTWQQQW